MNANAVSPTQFLMPVLDKEQGKISKGIQKHEFSKELRRQDLQLDNDSSADSSNSPLHDEIADTADSSRGLLNGGHSTPSGSNSSSTKEVQEIEKKIANPKRAVSSKNNSGKSTEKAKEDLVFTDPALLGKVLAQLNVSADTRRACKSAEDTQGRVSIQALLNALDKQTLQNSAITQEGIVTGQDVRQLLASLAQAMQGSSTQNQMAPATLADTYNRIEFRQLMEEISKKFAAQSAKTTASTSGNAATQAAISSVTSNQSTSSGTLTDLGTSQKSVPQATDVPRLASTILPSFTKDKSASDANHDAKTENIAASSKNEQQSATIDQKATWAQDIAKRLDELARQGGGTQVVQLKPESLGKVALTVDQGTSPATVSVVPDNQAVKTQLLENLPLIRQELQKRSFVLGEIRIDTAQSKQSLSSMTASLGDDASIDLPGLQSDSSSSVQSTPVNTQASAPKHDTPAPRAATAAPAAQPAAEENSDSATAAGTAKSVSGTDATKLGKLSESLAGKIPADPQILDRDTHEARNTSDQPRDVSKLTPPVESNGNSSEAKNSSSQQGNGADSFHPQRPNVAAPLGSVQANQQQTATVSAPFQSEVVRQTGVAGAQQNTLSILNPAWPQELAQKMRDLNARNDARQLTLELHPEGLGRLTLHIGTKDQEVTATLSADSQHVKELLMRNAPSLREHLESNGLTLSNFSVDVRQENNGSFYQARQEVERQTRNTTTASKDQPKERIAKAASVYRRNTEDQIISVFA